MTFKIEIFRFITKVNPNNENEAKSQAFFHETYSNLTPYLFYQKILKYFDDFQNQNFSSFMTKVNPNNGNGTKTDIFPWHIFKYEIMFHWS